MKAPVVARPLMAKSRFPSRVIQVADFMDQDDELSDELRAVYPKLCEQLKR